VAFAAEARRQAAYAELAAHDLDRAITRQDPDRLWSSIHALPHCNRSPRAGRVSQTSDELIFSNGSVIRAFPCSARSIRGGAWSCAVLGELGHFVTTEEGNAAGDRILEAALPSLAQFGNDGWPGGWRFQCELRPVSRP
jgi:hypothetical protein